MFVLIATVAAGAAFKYRDPIERALRRNNVLGVWNRARRSLEGRQALIS